MEGDAASNGGETEVCRRSKVDGMGSGSGRRDVALRRHRHGFGGRASRGVKWSGADVERKSNWDLVFVCHGRKWFSDFAVASVNQ